MSDATEVMSLFRRRALARHAGGADDIGEVLQVTPRWTRSAWRVLVVALVASTLFVIVGRIHEYAAGPAVVWMEGRTEIPSPAAGTVAAVAVRPGEHVDEGAVLLRLHDAREAAELERIGHEFDLQLVKTLRDPLDEIARQALTTLRAERDLAAARLEELVVRAPRAGVVGDVRIRPGQALAAGETVLTFAAEGDACSVLAMLPGHFRPQLRPGMPLRFEVGGYRYAYQDLEIESVATQLIGPGEVKRFLGAEIADTVSVEGPVVLVTARVRSGSFTVDRASLDLYHGMKGTAEARVHSESILVALVPALRVVLEGDP